MTDYSRTATNLGAGIYREFYGADNAPIPLLRSMMKDTSPEIAENIATQWGLAGTKHLSNAKNGLFDIMPSALPHRTEWLFVLRAAQCAALAERRMQVRLVPSPNVTENPRLVALETVQDIGNNALGLLGSVIDTEFLSDPDQKVNTWTAEAKDIVARLCMKPDAFFRAMRVFAGLASPERLPHLLENGPHDSMQALYRIGTASAVLSHELQIDFVPFSQPHLTEIPRS